MVIYPNNVFVISGYQSVVSYIKCIVLCGVNVEVRQGQVVLYSKLYNYFLTMFLCCHFSFPTIHLI